LPISTAFTAPEPRQLGSPRAERSGQADRGQDRPLYQQIVAVAKLRVSTDVRNRTVYAIKNWTPRLRRATPCSPTLRRITELTAEPWPASGIRSPDLVTTLGQLELVSRDEVDALNQLKSLPDGHAVQIPGLFDGREPKGEWRA
jgi:hypothetical protein